MFPTFGEPGIGIVQGINQPEDKTVKRILCGQTELFDDANIFSNKAPGWSANLLQCQLEVRNIARFDSNCLTTDEINGETIASGNKYLQVGLVAVERSI